MKKTNVDYNHSKRDGGLNSQKNTAMLNLKGKAKRRKANKVANKQRNINRKTVRG